MTTQDFINQKIKILETCSPVDVSKQGQAILESIVSLEKNEQLEIGEALVAWAEKYANARPLLFCYTKLLVAFSLFYTEQYDKAFQIVEELKNSFAELSDPDGAALCRVIQAAIYRTWGNVDLALKAAWTAHEQLAKGNTSPHYLLAIENNIANIYFESKLYDQAVPLFKNSLELAKKTSRHYWFAYALHGLGKVYIVQKKYTEAKECFEEAMAISDRSGYQVAIANSLSELGNYYFAVGDFEKAEEFHHQALALREKQEYIGGAITSCVRLAEIYIQHKKNVDAIEILKKGLLLADKIKVKARMYRLHQLLSEIYERTNELPLSLSHFKQFHSLREQVEMEDNERKIRNAQMVFEAEHTKQENVIIKKQKSEIEKKNIELQETVDKLTKARIGKKARAITLVIAIALFMLEDLILHFALSVVDSNNYFISMAVKIVIIFSLGPINKAVEEYLLKKVIKEKREVLV